MEIEKYVINFKFGDVVLNHYAGENNPHRIGVFVKYCIRQRGKAIELTNMKGDFWYLFRDKDSRNEIIGSIFRDYDEIITKLWKIG
jgi:hypothetical protein